MGYKFLEPEDYPSGFYLLKHIVKPTTAGAIALIIAEIASDAPFRRMETQSGKEIRAMMTNCGQYGWVSDSSGYRYAPLDPESRKPWPNMPLVFKGLTHVALQRTCGFPEDYEAQSCLINLYEPTTGKLGKHIDNTEKCDMPIVSFSLGAPCVFGIEGGNVLLEEGDICVMSGESRFIKHEVKKILPGASEIVKAGYRISMTVRQVYPLKEKLTN